MASSSPVTFSYNISFTTLVNTDDTSSNNDTTTAPLPKLTAAELWLGIRHVARTPQEFAPYVSRCDVLWSSQGGNKLGRAVTLGDGGVHTDNGQVLYQQVDIAEGLQVVAKTLDTGAKTTFLVSYLPSAGQPLLSGTGSETEIAFTVVYELKLVGVQKGSDKAKEIERDYPELARKACVDTVRQIKEAKADGRMAAWAAGQ